MLTLGIDTSNYTTSCALFNSETGEVIQKKMLLPVKDGEKGLRQSDAVFHHTRQLYPLMEELFSEYRGDVDIIGVSDKPRDAEGSYMPCFTVGMNTAYSISAAMNRPVYSFSHQAGHIMASLYSSGNMQLKDEKFIAFHVSGGTTEALLVSPDKERIFNAKIIGKTRDINCGQSIDRAGVMMGLHFPCGKEIEKLALSADKKLKPYVCMKDGDCCLSGLENMTQKMLDSGESKENIALFVLDSVSKTIEKMTEYALLTCGNLPVVYAGGVMSDKLIKNQLENKFTCSFALPEFSCDNAAGTAILAYFRGKE